MLVRPRQHRRLLLAALLVIIALPGLAAAEEPNRIFVPAGSSSTLYFDSRPMRIETNEDLALTTSISGHVLTIVLEKVDKEGPDPHVKLFWEEFPNPPLFDGTLRRRMALRTPLYEIETGHGEF